ncbi:MAG: prepilin peptidase, partial [Eubacterium sp.]|nr:prepilin peptidase [Eubacterium sp.]
MTDMFYIILTIIIFLYGIVIGSFLNVCILRIPEDESIVTVGSH